MEKLKKMTIIFMVITAVIVAAYDIFIYVKAGNGEATISRIIYYWAVDWPIATFTSGVFTGHFLWPQTPQRTKKP